VFRAQVALSELERERLIGRRGPHASWRLEMGARSGEERLGNQRRERERDSSSFSMDSCSAYFCVLLS
jgi:hypothetical protein